MKPSIHNPPVAFRCIAFSVLLAVVSPTITFAAASAGNAAHERAREWTAEDLVGIRNFYPGRVYPSPDGTKFYIITSHADLKTDSVLYELRMYVTADLKKALSDPDRSGALPPCLQQIVRRSWAGGGSAFGDCKWDDAGTSVSFISQDEAGAAQEYRLDVASGKLDQLTQLAHRGVAPGTGVMAFGKTILARQRVPSLLPRERSDYPTYVPNSDDLSILFEPRFPSQAFVTFVAWNSGKPWQVKGGLVLSAVPSSADGRRLLAICRAPVSEIPRNWSGYDHLGRRLRTWHSPLELVGRFTLINAEQQSDQPVFDAPSGLATEIGAKAVGVPPAAFWAADGRHAILANTALPLMGEKYPARTRMAYIVVFDAETGGWKELEPLETTDSSTGEIRSVVQVGWLKQGVEFLVRHEIAGKAASGTIYRLQQGEWVPETVAESVVLPPANAERKNESLADGLKVALRQGENEPPVFMVSDGQHEMPLTGPDPALKGLWLAPQKRFEWREPGGQMRVGGLTLPEKKGGQFPPLVIQAYQYQPDKFKPDGPTPYAYAGQVFVSRGMAVLTITIPSYDGAKVGKPVELTDFVAEVDSAADALASQGLIDRSRVGLIGFSRAGYLVYYAITHPGKVPLAAAIVDDGYTGSYDFMEMTEAFIRGGSIPYGNKTFWQDKATWLEHETSFNTDRIRTPVLMTMHNQNSLVFEWSTMGAFLLNRKPMELLVFPDAAHGLDIPRQRLASYQSSIDWMTFWLKGEPPSDVECAARWAILREQQDEVLKTPPPPKGKWQFIPDPVQPEWHPPGEAKKEERKPEPAGAGKN